jgi:hypothetical protein
MPLRQGGTGKTEVNSSLKRKRKENLFLTSPKSPELKNKNRYAPLSNLVDNKEANDITLPDINNTHYEIRKIPPIFVHNMTNYKQFHLSLATVAQDYFTIELYCLR